MDGNSEKPVESTGPLDKVATTDGIPSPHGKSNLTKIEYKNKAMTKVEESVCLCVFYIHTYIYSYTRTFSHSLSL